MAKRRFYTTKEAAEILGITVHALFQRIYRNQVPHRRLGGRVVIPQEDLDEFLAGLPGVNAQAALDSVMQSTR